MSDTNVPANISVTARDHEVTEALLHESDRGCVLLGAALLDEALEETLRAAFRNDAAARRDVQSLFKAAYAPLRSFAVKAQLAFALGLISRRVFDRITIIRQLRNAFAHSHGHLDSNRRRPSSRATAVVWRSSWCEVQCSQRAVDRACRQFAR